jgi:ribosomal protein S18 acetylase RimI-like enzyme
VKNTEYNDPGKFLEATRRALEANEPLHGLMLGISLRLVEKPVHDGTRPYLATIASGGELDLISIMTPPRKLQIASLRGEQVRSVQLLASKLHTGGWNVPAAIAEEGLAKRLASEWTKLTSARSEEGMRQRIYELRAVEFRDYPNGRFRAATMDDIGRVEAWTNAFQEECFGSIGPEECAAKAKSMIENGKLHFWEDRSPVAMAGLTRSTKRGVSISYVYTPPEFRRNGYASALVASLSRLALEGGKEFCTLYTDLSNPTSNSIYQRVGYRAVADVIDVTFSSEIG